MKEKIIFLYHMCCKKNKQNPANSPTNREPDEIPELTMFNQPNIFENKRLFTQASFRLGETYGQVPRLSVVFSM